MECSDLRRVEVCPMKLVQQEEVKASNLMTFKSYRRKREKSKSEMIDEVQDNSHAVQTSA